MLKRLVAGIRLDKEVILAVGSVRDFHVRGRRVATARGDVPGMKDLAHQRVSRGIEFVIGREIDAVTPARLESRTVADVINRESDFRDVAGEGDPRTDHAADGQVGMGRQNDRERRAAAIVILVRFRLRVVVIRDDDDEVRAAERTGGRERHARFVAFADIEVIGIRDDG